MGSLGRRRGFPLEADQQLLTDTGLTRQHVVHGVLFFESPSSRRWQGVSVRDRDASATFADGGRAAHAAVVLLWRDQGLVGLTAGASLRLFARAGLIGHLSIQQAPIPGDAGADALMTIITASEAAGRFLLG